MVVQAPGVGPEFGDHDENERAAGIAIGAAAGAVIGGLIGYLVAKEEEAPPPPPPPPPPPARPAPPPPPAPGPISKKIVLRGINFDFNKYNIKREFVPVLDQAAQILKDNPSVKVTVQGRLRIRLGLKPTTRDCLSGGRMP